MLTPVSFTLNKNLAEPSFMSANNTELVTKTRQEIEIYLSRRKKKNIQQYDDKKIEGIQQGIKIFDGLNIKQIKQLISTLFEITIQRGCHNMCQHCYADAKPPKFKPDNNYINSIAFEDFKDFCDGFQELSKRFKFNVFNHSNSNHYFTLFHDADSSTIYLQDKQGKMHDYLDLSKMLFDTTKKPVAFDTSGWNIQDKKTQNRMNELISKMCASSNYDCVTWSISINPFHGIYGNSLKAKNTNNPEKEKKFMDIYTKRMANVLYTFTPLIEAGKDLSIIERALPNSMENVSGYRVQDLIKLNEEILAKLKDMYVKDSLSEQPKLIKNKDNITKYLDYYKNSMAIDDKNLCITGRLRKIVPAKYESIYQDGDYDAGILDINGKFYLSNWDKSYKTPIQLNFTNKDKETAPIKP